MKHPATQYKRHRFPPEIIQYAVWLYYRFNLSHRDIEDLLAAHRLRRRHRGYGDTLFIDETPHPPSASSGTC